MINKTANDTNVSMNTTGIDILNKLHFQQSIVATNSKEITKEEKPINLDNFDA